MYCEQCGKQNEDGKKYCFYCGSPLVQHKKKGEGRQKSATAIRSMAGANKNPSFYSGKNTAESDQRVDSEEKITSDIKPDIKPAFSYSKQEQAESEKLAEMEKELQQLSRDGKPMAAVIAALAVLAVAVFLLFGKVPKLYGAQQDAEAFEAALLSGKWEEAYEYLLLDNETSPFLSKDMFVQVMARSGADGYRNLELQEVSKTDDQKIFAVSYESAKGPQTSYVTMQATGRKKMLFLKEWKVDPSTVCTSNVTISVPAEASLLINGLEPESEAVIKREEHAAEYTFEKLFSGIWTAELQAENRAPYSEDITVSDGTENGVVSLLSAELKPDQTLMDQLLNQFAQDYQAILTASVNREDFSVVESYFASQAREEGRAQIMYANACSQAYDPATGRGILRYEMSDIAAQFVPTVKSGYAQDGDLVMEIQSIMSYTYIEDGIEKMDTQNSVGILCYHQENGKWKIQSFS